MTSSSPNEAFVPLRTIALLPSDAVLGEPYTLLPSKLCDNCRSAITTLCSAKPPTVIKEYTHHPSKKVLGTLRELRARDSCPLCQLTVKSVDHFCPPYAKHSKIEDEEIKLVTDLVRSDHKLSVVTSKFYIGDIEKVSDLLHHEISTVNIGDDAVQSSQCVCCNLPKRLCPKCSSQIDYEAVRVWLQSCETTHSTCNAPITRACQETATYPSVLIDVARKCLVLTEVSTRYCALSFVYGGCQLFKTTKETFQMLQKAGALEQSWINIPAVIRDAIALTESIGERFLWTDSLCIVHDDDEEFRGQIEHMDIIYGQAVLTFAITSGSHANEPIPGVRPRSRSCLPITKLWHTDIFFRPVPIHLELKGSTYETRAWTLQERILSTRLLIVTNSGVYFYCRGRFHQELVWSTAHAELTLNTFISNSSPRINPLHESPFEEDQRMVQHEGVESLTVQTRWSTYFELVRWFSARKLIYEADALFAFAGIQATLEQIYHATFHYGLPDIGATIALHWIPGVEGEDDFVTSVSMLIQRRRPIPQFPSYSWVGWLTPIEWIEAVVLPEWWQLKTVANATRNSIDDSCNVELLIDNAVLAPCTIMLGELCDSLIYPEKVISPGAGFPLPLIKLVDKCGRWCGRLCSSSKSVLQSTKSSRLDLLLLSTCAARRIHVQSASSLATSSEYLYSFDTDAFPTHQPDGIEARLVNLLLVSLGATVQGKYDRIGLCQIHIDVWESMEKNSTDVVLI